MKKFFIFILILLIILILSLLITNFLQTFSPVSNFSSNSPNNQKGADTYLSLNKELSIDLPPEYQVFEKNDVKYPLFDGEGQNILVATGPKSSLTIEKIFDKIDPTDKTANQVKQIIDYIYDKSEKVSTKDEGSAKIFYKNLGKGYLGSNYYLFKDGEMEMEVENGIFKKNVRQYFTYYGSNSYVMQFYSELSIPPDYQLWDQIVSSIVFK